MVHTFLGKKLFMTSRFDATGVRRPVTVVSVEPNVVMALRTQDKDFYTAAQIGTGIKKHSNKPMQGHIKKATIDKAPYFIKETRINEELLSDLAPGQSISITDVVSNDSIVDVQGTSKGKGFQGGMKRWGFHGGPASHGQSDRSRAPGSIGSGTTPGRVYKGKKMAGHMGADTVTIKNLEVFSINAKDKTLEIVGALPGSRNGYVVITVVGTNKKYVGPAVKEEEEPVIEEALNSTVDEGAEAVFEAEGTELRPEDDQPLADVESTESSETSAETEEAPEAVTSEVEEAIAPEPAADEVSNPDESESEKEETKE